MCMHKYTGTHMKPCKHINITPSTLGGGQYRQRGQYTQHFLDAHTHSYTHTHTHLRFLVEGDVGHLLSGIEEGVLNRLGQDVLHMPKQYIYICMCIFCVNRLSDRKGPSYLPWTVCWASLQHLAHPYSIYRIPIPSIYIHLVYMDAH